MFSVASNFDDALPSRLQGMEVDELFGSCDDVPVGHGRPRAVLAPVSWRRLERHVAIARRHGIGFNLLMNPLCLGGREWNTRLESGLNRALQRAVDLGIGSVTVSHPWLLELAVAKRMKARISVFTGIATVEAAQFWDRAGAAVLCLDSHVLSRDLPLIRRIVAAVSARIELPVNIGCLLRCPLARNHAARLSHASLPGAQPIDPFYVWCKGEKCGDPLQVVRSDFIRPEDLGRYEAAGVRHFKIVDRSCSSDALVQRVAAWHGRRWDGDLLELIGPRGRQPRRRLPPLLDLLRHVGLRRLAGTIRFGRRLVEQEIPWRMDNRQLDGLLLPDGCDATGCATCGHCARMAAMAVTPRPVAVP